MVNVKLFGLFRLDTGIRELRAEAATVGELYPALLREAKRLNPDTTITAKDIDGCVIAVNGAAAKKNTKLRDGDEVTLLSPVCGG